jgi:hypothetical protein
MSTWINIRKQEDIEVDEDEHTLDVYIGSDNFGANYISIPVRFILNILKDNEYL